MKSEVLQARIGQIFHPGQGVGQVGGQVSISIKQTWREPASDWDAEPNYNQEKDRSIAAMERIADICCTGDVVHLSEAGPWLRDDFTKNNLPAQSVRLRRSISILNGTPADMPTFWHRFRACAHGTNVDYFGSSCFAAVYKASWFADSVISHLSLQAPIRKHIAMSLFYVHVNSEVCEPLAHLWTQPESTSSKYWHPLTIGFVNCEVADEWWRTLSAHPEMSKKIKRICPQLYAWTGAINIVHNSYLPPTLYDTANTGALSQFSEKMVYLWQNHGQSESLGWQTYGPVGIIPTQDARDLISGNS